MIWMTCRVGQWWGYHLQVVWPISSVYYPQWKDNLFYSLSWITESYSDIVLVRWSLGSSDTVLRFALTLSPPRQPTSIVSLAKCLVCWVLGPHIALSVNLLKGPSYIIYLLYIWLGITIFLPTFFLLLVGLTSLAIKIILSAYIHHHCQCTVAARDKLMAKVLPPMAQHTGFYTCWCGALCHSEWALCIYWT